jgi:hypothetical protein
MMAARDLVSVPLPYSRPAVAVQADGPRPDGRGYEELRQVCKSHRYETYVIGSSFNHRLF